MSLFRLAQVSLHLLLHMAATSVAQVREDVRAAFVKSVKLVLAANPFVYNEWLNFLHANTPANVHFQNVDKDPALYSACLLGDFLQIVGTKCDDESAVGNFKNRKRKNGARHLQPAHVFVQSNDPCVQFICILVGDAVLQGMQNLSCNFREVALPTGYVHHSGVAVAMLISNIATGILAQSLGVKLASSLTFGCIHFEGKFSSFPNYPTEKPHVQRIDNINLCLRAWGVDAGATRSISGKAVRSNLHPGLRHFVGVGSGAQGPKPCFHIEPDSFLNSLAIQGKKVLHDAAMVEQLYLAQRYYNGISLWSTPEDSCAVEDFLEYYGLNLASTLILVLSPLGVPLQPPSGYARRQPHNIYAR